MPACSPPGRADDCDPLHMNYIEPVGAAAAAHDPLLEPGDLLVSLRNLNALVLLDAEDRRVKWLLSGVTGQQHSPQLGAEGDILMFDNFGGELAAGGSRIVRTRVGAAVVEQLFPVPGQPPGTPFFTGVGGHIERHPTAPGFSRRYQGWPCYRDRPRDRRDRLEVRETVPERRLPRCGRRPALRADRGLWRLLRHSACRAGAAGRRAAPSG